MTASGEGSETIEPWSRNILFLVRVQVGSTNSGGQDPLCCRDDYAVPRISIITIFGEMTIDWSKKMIEVEEESTLYEQNIT